jgi:carboxypeptidase family protein
VRVRIPFFLVVGVLTFCLNLLSTQAAVGVKTTISGQVTDMDPRGFVIGISGVIVTAGAHTNVTDGSGSYTITNLAPATYTVTPNKAGDQFTPAARSVSTAFADATGVDFQVAHTIQGFVRDGPSGVSNVTVSAGGRSTTTGANGQYILNDLPPGTYNVTASRTNYEFSPIVVRLGSGFGSDVNFEALWEVAGYIGIPDWFTNRPLSGVTVSAGSQSAVTDNSGDFSFKLTNGTYVLTPAKSEYYFTPASLSLVVTGYHGGVFFDAYPVHYSIGGRVTFGGNPVSGAQIQIGADTRLTDANGYYRYDQEFVSGTYAVSASLEGYYFTPASRNVAVGPDNTSVDFAIATFNVSGRVMQGSNGVSGVSVRTGGPAATTDANGYYTLSNLAGSYVIEPVQSGQVFNPFDRTLTVGPGLTNADFQRGTNWIRTVVTTCDRVAFQWAMNGGGLIQFDRDGSIVLTNQIDVAVDTSISAAARQVEINGGNKVRLFNVESNITLTLDQLTLSQGKDSKGGAIYNDGGAVVISNSVVANNHAPAGSAIFNADGHLLISQTMLTNNVAFGSSGTNGGFTAGGGRGGAAWGGAIFNQNGQVEINGSTFFGNSVWGGNGGSGTVGGGGGDALGAGVYSTNGSLFITNTTFAANSVNGGPGGSGNAFPGPNGSGLGAAVFSQTSSVWLVNCTIASNTNSLYNLGPMALQNTIVANSTGFNHSGNVLSDAGHNLSSDASCSFTNSGSMNGTDPKLGPLQNNGGLTLTMALLPGSPAIDAADSAAAPATDQRGLPRPFNQASDIGAFEYFAGFFRITSLSLAGSAWSVRGYGIAQRPYRLQGSASLTNWTDVESNYTAPNGSFQSFDTNSASTRFYRIASP